MVMTQFYRARAYHSTPWKGGSFGMFSTIDLPPSRLHRVYLIQGDTQIPILTYISRYV